MLLFHQLLSSSKVLTKSLLKVSLPSTTLTPDGHKDVPQPVPLQGGLVFLPCWFVQTWQVDCLPVTYLGLVERNLFMDTCIINFILQVIIVINIIIAIILLIILIVMIIILVINIIIIIIRSLLRILQKSSFTWQKNQIIPSKSKKCL